MTQLYSWKLMPEAAFFKQLIPDNFNYQSMPDYKFLFYLMVFAPLGCLTALLSAVVTRKSTFKNLFSGFSIAFIAALLQIVLAYGAKTNFSIGNFIVSIGIAITAVFLVNTVIFFRVTPKLRLA